jgi:hypothetical protein
LLRLNSRLDRAAVWLRTFGLGALAALTLAAPAAHALSPADQQEIGRFTLTEGFLQRYAAAVHDANSTHVSLAQRDGDPKKMASTMSSLDAMTAEVAKSPAVVAILQRHGLGARQVIVGGLVIFRAGMADAMLANPSTAAHVDSSMVASPVNMAFYRAHRAEIIDLQREMSRAKE